MTIDHLSDVTFASLNLPESLQKGVDNTGFTHCTPIQAKSLPLALNGADVAGQAQTGTGKTAAFLLAAMNAILQSKTVDKDRGPNRPVVLIVAPTRELAVQIYQEALQLGKFTGLRSVVAYGGTSLKSQKDALDEGVDMLIGTPGRLIDCHKQGWANLKHVEVTVLDEADRMFDLGFIDQIRFLLRRLPRPEKRLNMLFSATLSFRVMELAYEHMNSPTLVKVEGREVTADRVDETVFMVGNDEKIPLLLGLLRKFNPMRTILFINTKKVAEEVVAYLKGNGFDTDVLSGDVPQNQRLKLLERFQDGSLPILVATDVAARGLHIPEVSHVINYDLPQDAEEYVHRIGRTGRIGAAGNAISFACERYSYSLPEIEAYIGHKIPVASITSDLLVEPLPPEKIHRYSKPGPRSGSKRPGKSGSGNAGRRRGGPPRHNR